ncbi:MAG: hypothetical protein EOP33_01000 [Rickettsiaceae bacterium]|nr:MAG: hypothetical protein EOP33_01000 [Rickettsiaceae bacterium]
MSDKTIADYKKDYTKPELRLKLKEEIKHNDQGGKSDQWSARKSQLLKHEYEKQGGSYKHPNKHTKDQENLSQWSKQDWQTDDHQNAIKKDQTTRYLPKKAWQDLSKEERNKANSTKIVGSKTGQQHVHNTKEVKEAIKNNP